jgi:hypothetical protein
LGSSQWKYPIRGNATCKSYDPGNPNDHYINPDSIVNPPAFTLGNISQFSNVRACGPLNESFAIFKAFRIGERYKFQVGADVINAFNRHMFYGGSETAGIAQSTGRFDSVTAGRAVQVHAQVMF